MILVPRAFRPLGIVLIGLLLGGCAQTTHAVRYEVSGSASPIAISYINATGATEQRNVSGRWSVQYQVKTWTYISVSAFNPTPAGTIRCRVYVDGLLLQAGESIGGYKWVGCGGLASIANGTVTPQQPTR